MKFPNIHHLGFGYRNLVVLVSFIYLPSCLDQDTAK